jgi:hypothetical protein
MRVHSRRRGKRIRHKEQPHSTIWQILTAQPWYIEWGKKVYCTVFTDGGCSNNNQPELFKRHMRAVVLAEWDGRILADIQQRGGSNNIAEFMAVEQALLWAKLYGYTQLEIRTDSRNNLAWPLAGSDTE